MSPSVKRSLSVHFEDANFSLLDKEEAIQAKTAEAWQEMPDAVPIFQNELDLEGLL
jgi:hypothetical protein